MKNKYKLTFKKWMKAMIIIPILSIVGLFFILIAYIAIVSPGKPETFKDQYGNVLKGSISEKIFIDIGGVKQGMFIRSKNINNPVLLFVHGGPGFPIYSLFEKFNPDFEEYFTVCYWEQRGSGLSYTNDVSRESMNLDQLSNDAIEVSNYLRERFGMEKIFIMGHSGGTTVALPAVSKAPELYYAYIAIAQLTTQSESEKIAYDFMLQEFTERDDKSSIKEMLKYKNLTTDSDILAFYNSGFRDKAMHELGIGTMKNMKSIISGLFLPVWTCKAYTLSEKFNFWRSKFFFLPKTKLRSETLWTDFSAKYPRVEIPVYFICGRNDLTVNYHLTENYYNQLQAPIKRLYIFENSAHSPFLEEPEKFLDILKTDVLKL